MKIKMEKEMCIGDFEFYGKANENACKLTYEQLNATEGYFGNEVDEIDLNNAFSKSFDEILEFLKLKECKYCGEVHSVNTYCFKCESRCENCGKVILKEEFDEHFNLCISCFKSDYYHCEECGGTCEIGEVCDCFNGN